MYRGVTGERRAWVDEVRSFVYIDNPGGSGTWYSWDADAHMSTERYIARHETGPVRQREAARIRARAGGIVDGTSGGNGSPVDVGERVGPV